MPTQQSDSFKHSALLTCKEDWILQNNPPVNGQIMFINIFNKCNNTLHSTIQTEQNKTILASISLDSMEFIKCSNQA